MDVEGAEGLSVLVDRVADFGELGGDGCDVPQVLPVGGCRGPLLARQMHVTHDGQLANISHRERHV